MKTIFNLRRRIGKKLIESEKELAVLNSYRMAHGKGLHEHYDTLIRQQELISDTLRDLL